MKIIIVGGGVAGVTAAKTIAENDPQLKIEVFTDEDYPYYSKIRLPQLLAGKIDLPLIYMYPPEWYEAKGIPVHLGKKVSKIDSLGKEIQVDEQKIGYDKLLLATGSHPFVPPIKGLPKKGAFTFNSAEDALTMREYSQKIKKAIVVGGGVLGLESAAALESLGLDVTVVEIFPRLLPKQLDEDGAGILKSQIEQLGIEVILGAQTAEVLGEDNASGILLKDGRKLSGELLLISAGIRANLKLAKEAQLKTEKGVVVNNFMETTKKDIYAAGDVAEHEGRVYGIIPPSIEQAKVAALNMLQERSVEYKGSVPSNTLKVAGVSLTSIGLAQPTEDGYDVLKSKEETSGTYKKIVIKDNRVVGAILLGERKDVAPIRRMISEKIDVSRFKDRLLSKDFDLKQVLADSSPP